MADRMLSSQATGDYASFAADFTQDLRAKLPEEDFLATSRRIVNDYGKPVTRTRLCILHGSSCIPVLWTVRFDRTAQEFLFQLRLGRPEGRLQVDSVLLRGWMV